MLPTDPLVPSQWYLSNTGQRGEPGIDLNLLPVWGRYTGNGIVVAVNDDGMDLTHPDLAANILLDQVYNTVTGTTGQGLGAADSSHGTVVGSIIGMVANNGIGGTGIAYGARLVPGLSIGNNLPENGTEQLFLANLAAGAHVSCNSWGDDSAFIENFGASGADVDRAWGAALAQCVTTGRGGLGMIIEVSGGNERANGADTALSNFTGNKHTIAVAALDHRGVVTDYSTPGISLLVTGPGGAGENPQTLDEGFGIVSADVAGAGGYNMTAGDVGNYAYQNVGTSYSGPMVAAISALMLEANPGLGFRDVSSILAMTARQTDAANPSWVQQAGGHWNLAGMHYSRDYGYGLVDAAAAVRLAESWAGGANTVANWRSEAGVATAAPAAIADGTAAPLQVTATVGGNLRIDRVEFSLELGMSAPSQLSATITSPAGTTFTLFDRPLTRPLVNGTPDVSVPETAWPGVFTIGAAAFQGENSQGTWTLQLRDHVAGDVATYQSFAVTAWGSANLVDDQYVFTDEYAGERPLNDTGGVDTLNAAAMSGPVTLDLNGGTTSTLGAGNLTIGAASVVENAIGGAGSDLLRGNAAGNLLRGNGGNDTLEGGAGIDVARFTGRAAEYGFTARPDPLTPGSPGAATVTDTVAMRDGIDSLVGIERLQTSDAWLAIDLDGSAGTVAKLLGAVFGPASVANQAFVGIGLDYLDNRGFDYAALSQLAISARLGAAAADNVAVVDLLYTNVAGVPPAPQDRANFVGLLENGTYTVASLGVFAADYSLNLTNIGLIGLAQSGLAYQPQMA